MIRKEMLFTPAQNNALSNIQTLTGDKSYADLVRRLLAQEAERVGVSWPDDMPTKKDNAKKGVSKRWPKQDEEGE